MDEPILSAEVFVIKGDKYTYLFDVGNNKDIIDEINKLKIKDVILSHFHLDHVGSLKCIDCEKVLCSSYTSTRIDTNNYEIVENVKEIIDGKLRLKIIKIPSTHSKGSLVLNINQEYTLVGDGLYGERRGYNVSLLYEMIKEIKKIETTYFVLSHGPRIITKEELITELENTYSKKIKGEDFIPWD